MHNQLLEIIHQIKSGELSKQSMLRSINTHYLNMNEYKKEFSNMNTKEDYSRIIQEENK